MILVAYLVITAGAGAVLTQAKPSLPHRTSYLANFTASMNQSADLGYGTPPTLPGLYDELYYSVFQSYFAPVHVGPDSGIYPHSLYWGAAFGHEAISFTNGLPDTPSTASISVNYNASKALAFDLSSFWFGCTEVNSTSSPDKSETLVLNNPSNCTFTVKGYRATRKTLPGPTELADAVAEFSYVPQSVPNSFLNYLKLAPMQQATLPKTFLGLKTVTFTVSNKTQHADPYSDSVYQAPAGYIDDLKYTVLSY